MKSNLSRVTAGALCLLGMATFAIAAPSPTERSGSSGTFWSNIFGARDDDAASTKRAKTVQIKYAAKKTVHAAAKKPKDTAQPDQATIAQAVRDFFANNKDVVREAVVDALRNDPDAKKLLATPADRSTAPQATTPPQAATSPDQARIEGVVRNYLLQHPEVLQEAMAVLEQRMAEEEAKKHSAAVKDNAQLLYNSPREVVLGNPQGDVTFVEFFDYNCGYCRRALSDMLDLMKSDNKLKVVLKEFPVLGPGSREAAEVAVAVRMQDKTGKKYLEFHQKMFTSRGQADRAKALSVAKEIGLDMTRLEKDMASPEVKATLDESMKLAEAIGLNGTPSYVVGPNVVVGAVGLDALRQKVNTARCGKETC